MKKSILLLLAVFITSTMCMGQRSQRRPAVRKVYKYASYAGESGIVKVSESKDWLYMLESGKYDSDNNGVIRVNKATGEGEVVIEGQAGIYEGRRDIITDIAVTDNDQLFFICGDYFKDSQKLYLWDGNSVKTSRIMCKAYEVKASPGGRYVVCRSDNHTAYIYDGITLEKVGTGSSLDLKYTEIDDSGALWDWNDRTYTPLGGKKKTINTNFEEISSGFDGYLSHRFKIFLAHGNNAYARYGRRIYVYKENNPDVFTEYAKVPRTSDWIFVDFVVTPSGDILTTNIYEHLVEYREGQFDTPIDYGFDGIQTDIYSIPDSPHRDVIRFAPDFVDRNGNYIIGKGAVYIYNPSGIKGYTKGLGRKNRIKK